MKKVLAFVLITVVVLSAALAGCAPKQAEAPAPAATEPPKAEPLKIGFVYIGSANDGGWSQAHDMGRQLLEKEFGDKVETIYKESVPESAECEKVINDMVDLGCKVVFTTSIGYMDYTEKAAKAHPDVLFYHCSGYKSGPNFVNYFGAMEEPRYLSGIVAGLKTKTGKLGYVAAFEFPEVVRGINAFTLGAQSVNPDVVVKVKWTHTWYDPAKEKEAAKALLDEGCDVLAQHQDSTATQQAAEEKGAFSIGYDIDSSAAAPKSYMTAPVWNWGAYYIDQVQSILDGTWKAENYYGHLKEGIIELAPLTANAPAEAQAAVDKATAAILDGSLKMFTGPIKDQAGAEKVPAGTTMTLEQQLAFDWFVQGVEGQIK